LGSNLGRPSDIGRPGRFGRVGAAALNAGGSVLRWRGLSSPEFAVYGVPGVNPAGVWLWGGQCDTRKLPEAKARWIRTRGGALDGEGGSGRRTSSAWGVWQKGCATAERKTRAKGRGSSGAHQSLKTSKEDVQGSWRRGPAASSGRRSGKSRCGGDPGSWAPPTDA